MRIPFKKRKIHLIKLPWRIAIGKGAIRQTPELLEDLNIKSTLVVAGPITNGLIGKDLSKVLKKSDCKFDFFIARDADFKTVKRAEKKGKELKVESLLGVGGGKNIDIAKTVASKLKVPYISVPTIPSHDGIASATSSISKKNSKRSTFLDPPAAIIADMKYLVKSPYRFFAAGAGDVIAKHTSVLDWKLARDEKGEYYGEYAAQIASLAAATMIKNSKGYRENPEDVVRLLIEALISCGYAMCSAGSSRPCSGSEHLFSHAIDRIFPENTALHGEKCALGTLIMSFYHDKDYYLVMQALLNLGLPTNAEQIKIPPKVLVDAVVNAHKIRRGRYTILNKLGINKRKRKKVEDDLKVLGII